MVADTISFKRELKNINICAEDVRLHGTHGKWTELKFENDVAKADLEPGEYNLIWMITGSPGGTMTTTITSSDGTALGKPCDKLGGVISKMNGTEFIVP